MCFEHRIENFTKCGDYARVKKDSFGIFDHAFGIIGIYSLFIGAGGCQCIKNIRHRANSCSQGNVLSFAVIGITRAIPPFMMSLCNDCTGLYFKDVGICE